MNYSLFRSKTFYSALALFIVTGGNAILPVLPPTVSAVLGAIFLVLASIFHLQTAVAGNVTN